LSGGKFAFLFFLIYGNFLVKFLGDGSAFFEGIGG
jgi:hypothetical protein